MISSVVDPVVRQLFSALSPAGQSARLSTLIFHRVLAGPDDIFPEETDHFRFDAICSWLAAWFNVLPLEEAVERLAKRSLPARALCITFDDGYVDNHDVALPILKRHGLPATLFVATGFLDGGRMWNDTIEQAVRHCKRAQLDLTGTACRELGVLDISSAQHRRKAIASLLGVVKYLPLRERLEVSQAVAEAADVDLTEPLMMSTGQLRAWRDSGMQVGAHTVNHPILAKLSDEEALREMCESRDTLVQVLGAPVTLFAYPNGKPVEDYTKQTAAIAKAAGFVAAVSTAPGVAVHGSDLFELPRFSPWDSHRMRYAARMALNYRQLRL